MRAGGKWVAEVGGGGGWRGEGKRKTERTVEEERIGCVGRGRRK